MMTWGCPILRNTQAYQQLNVIWKFEESSLSIPELQIAPCPEFPIIEVAHGAPWPVRSELQGVAVHGFLFNQKNACFNPKKRCGHDDQANLSQILPKRPVRPGLSALLLLSRDLTQESTHRSEDRFSRIPCPFKW